MRALGVATILFCLSGAAYAAESPAAPAASPAPAPVKIDFTKSLTGKPGDPAAGKKVFLSKTLGNCITCHTVSALKDEPFPGNFGPSLDGVAKKFKEPLLRMILIDSKKMYPLTVMPAFHKVGPFNRERPEFAGKPILNDQQLEDVLAYVETFN